MVAHVRKIGVALAVLSVPVWLAFAQFTPKKDPSGASVWPQMRNAIQPESGKLDIRVSPVLRIDNLTPGIDYPLTLLTIAGVDTPVAALNLMANTLRRTREGVGFEDGWIAPAAAAARPTGKRAGKRHDTFDTAPWRASEISLPEGTYDLTFAGGLYRITEIDKAATTTIRVDTTEPVGPLRLRLEAKNGRHYYVYPPERSVVYKNAPINVPEAAGAKPVPVVDGVTRVHTEVMYGILAVCGFSSDRALKPGEELEARRSADAACDRLDLKTVKPHASRGEATPPSIP